MMAWSTLCGLRSLRASRNLMQNLLSFLTTSSWSFALSSWCLSWSIVSNSYDFNISIYHYHRYFLFDICYKSLKSSHMFMVSSKCGRYNSRVHFSVVLRHTFISTVCVASLYVWEWFLGSFLFCILVNLRINSETLKIYWTAEGLALPRESCCGPLLSISHLILLYGLTGLLESI